MFYLPLRFIRQVLLLVGFEEGKYQSSSQKREKGIRACVTNHTFVISDMLMIQSTKSDAKLPPSCTINLGLERMTTVQKREGRKKRIQACMTNHTSAILDMLMIQSTKSEAKLPLSTPIYG